MWKDWAHPACRFGGRGGRPDHGIRSRGCGFGELSHLAPRAYVFTPFWNETADPALRKALETVLITPDADVTSVMQKAARKPRRRWDKNYPNERHAGARHRPVPGTCDLGAVIWQPLPGRQCPTAGREAG